MSDDAPLYIFAGLGLVVITIIITLMCANQSWQQEAVAHGHAVYSVDANGTTVWKWK